MGKVRYKIRLTIFLMLPLLFTAMSSQQMRIIILENEGLFIQSGQDKILIDAFTRSHNPEEESTKKMVEFREKMMSGQSPFDNIELALISHPHREHFIPEVAIEFLIKHPETVLVSSPSVIAAIRDKAQEQPDIQKRLKAMDASLGKISSFKRGNLRIEVLPFKHEASMFYEEVVLGYIIHLGSQQILHVGDAEMNEKNWKAYNLKERNINLALVPFWLYKEEVTRKIIDEYVNPEKTVVIQILSNEQQKKAKELSKTLSDVIFLTHPLDSITLP